MESKDLKVMVAGGCHVEAYPVGEKYAFGVLVAESLHAKYAAMQYANLNNIEKLTALLERDVPDVLVLQLGNYESPYSVKRQFYRTYPNLAKSKRANSPERGICTEPYRKFQATLRWRMGVLIRSLWVSIIQHTRFRVFDEHKIRTQLRFLLSQLKAFHIPLIVVMAPFPSADFKTRAFRVKSSEIFRQEALCAGVLWFDSAHALSSADAPGLGASNDDVYYDEHHLNALGHERLASRLGSLISSKVRSLSVA